MSHTTKVKLKYKDEEALKEALRALKYDFKEGTHKLYDGKCEGIGVYLNGWKYPVVFRKRGEEFEVLYDSWGTPREKLHYLDELLRELPEEYAYQVAKKIARKVEGKVKRYRKNGKTVIELDVPDKKVKDLIKMEV